ncbi:MAG TPA: methyltransferase domain-containing protein [Desulfuromonadales bacterium]|jgi:SAM-dependent methyltransferase
MDSKLLDLLICPACLPGEKPLRPAALTHAGGDVLAGRLECPGCHRHYPIEKGVAILLPEAKTAEQRAADRYESSAAVASYLWGHFGDLLDDPEATDAYVRWAGLVEGVDGPALDAGCAVGRLTFELGRHCELAVGIDRSLAFIRLARRLKEEGRYAFRLFLEGRLSERKTVVLPADWPRERCEFLVADAQALPFPRGTFHAGCSLNLVDKLPRPRRHLAELNRVALPAGARLLFADPFSWSPAAAPATEWLGGTTRGSFAGGGRENVRRLLETGLSPPWRVTRDDSVWWKLRSHRNHFELIRSITLLAER